MASKRPDPTSQLSLFAAPPAPEPLADVYADAARIAARLPDTVRFGTSSWSFPGWRGIVYARAASEGELAREGLREYARHPLLRTVGIDRGYYAPISLRDLERYAAQLPPGFRCVTKAPEAITTPVHLGHGRGVAGERNPEFLSAERFMETMGQPFLDVFREHTGPFVFEFPPVPPAHRLAPAAFAARLDAFLAQLPRTLSYAVELRDRALLTPEYRAVLAAHGVAHTYNYWTAMPLPAAQLARVPLEGAPFAVVRLLLRPGTKYSERKEAFAPFDRLVAPDEAMRRDVVAIVRAATAAGRPAYVLVNNKAEGSSPLTIRAIAGMLAGEGDAPSEQA
jgi:uncharacterized protein YecE (DUF72 family)